MLMKSRRTRSTIWTMLWSASLVAVLTVRSSVRADGIYSITDLGTLSGQSSSVATSINNQGQVVGISYNSSDGYFGTSSNPVTAAPATFNVTGGGASSFLYSKGQMTQISPNGGLATSINDMGQVVGGKSSSINDSGQYVTGPWSGINTGNVSAASQLSGPGTTTNLPALFNPYAINNSGQIAGLLVVNLAGHGAADPAIYQNGQLTDLVSKVASGDYYDGRAIAINQKGDVLITVQQYTGPVGSQVGPLNSYLYNASTGQVTALTTLIGGAGMVAAALNDKDQAVGTGFLYSKGSVQSLLSLLPSGSGWSNLNATGINDAGQIVGQGTYNGQLEAFEMNPSAANVPEPPALALWSVTTIATLLAVRSDRARLVRLLRDEHVR
jgi:uncharacterized membrane protein